MFNQHEINLLLNIFEVFMTDVFIKWIVRLFVLIMALTISAYSIGVVCEQWIAILR